MYYEYMYSTTVWEELGENSVSVSFSATNERLDDAVADVEGESGVVDVTAGDVVVVVEFGHAKLWVYLHLRTHERNIIIESIIMCISKYDIEVI